jgi:hypothetical protein
MNRTPMPSYHAIAEARLRNAPVLLIDKRVNSWIRRYADVHVRTVAEISARRDPSRTPGKQSN